MFSGISNSLSKDWQKRVLDGLKREFITETRSPPKRYRKHKTNQNLYMKNDMRERDERAAKKEQLRIMEQ